MAITAALVPSGKHHAVSSGTLTQGAAVGEVGGTGTNQLLLVALPFTLDVVTPAGFEDQLYLTSKSLDGFTTDVRWDAAPVQYDAAGLATARLRVDVNQLPAAVALTFEAHHSIGR